jgi:hypothetical protein
MAKKTNQTTTRMTSNDIAHQFYKQNLAGQWLSKKQTSWLYGQACREANRQLTIHGTPKAGGMFTLESGEAISWDIAVSSQNGCAVFKSYSVTALMEKQKAEQEAIREEVKELCKIIRGTTLKDLYSPERLAQRYKVPIETIHSWMEEEA